MVHLMRLPQLLRRRPAAVREYARSKLPGPGTSWREARFAVVDLELTGLDPGRDEIISFASVPVEGGRAQPGAASSTLVRPERMPDAETIRIHGLRPADLAKAQPLGDVLELILRSLAGRILVAHPARVEREFLNAALAPAVGRLKEPVICTATLAGRALGSNAYAPREVSLDDAVAALGLPAHDPHTAEGDALTTAQLFIALASRLDRDEPLTVGSLTRRSKPRT